MAKTRIDDLAKQPEDIDAAEQKATKGGYDFGLASGASASSAELVGSGTAGDVTIATTSASLTSDTSSSPDFGLGSAGDTTASATPVAERPRRAGRGAAPPRHGARRRSR